MLKYNCGKSLAVVFTLLLAPALTAGSTYQVYPDGTGDFPTIQAALGAVVNGDVIELGSGTFSGPNNRDLFFLGKEVTIQSISGDPKICIIDCEGSSGDPHRGFNFILGETYKSVIRGLTITGGWVADDLSFPDGGAILCTSSPIIDDCILTNNYAYDGGAMMIQGDPVISNCTISLNYATHKGGGVFTTNSSLKFTGCVFQANNSGVNGGALYCEWSSVIIEQSTLVYNDAPFGTGSIVLFDDTHLIMANSIIAFGLRASIRCRNSSSASLACCDIYGNTGYDWSECIETQLGLDGNIRKDPLFCDAGGGDFALTEASPCAPDNHPSCGLIGAYSVGCGIAVIVSDVPDDQGGYLNIFWERFAEEDPGSPSPVTYYEAQRFETDWTTLVVVSAQDLPTYETIVETDDIFTVGEPAPTAPYRVVGRTDNPEYYYPSRSMDGYSIDNLPPPTPVLKLVEDLGYRHIIWSNEEPFPDPGTFCLYRGTESGFEPGPALNCWPDTSGLFTEEPPLRLYFYVGRYMDLHGNLGDWSDELASEYPSGFDDPPGPITALEGVHPNPFNPQTTIFFSISRTQHVNISVFDLAGRCVAQVTNQQYGAGTHDVEWDGRDMSGLVVASGTYLVRMDTGDSVYAKKAILVR
ncbi:MAG: T9SS type A sorting domain-containing protein [bacterium]